MKQHPVPQHISSYEFKLVGDMTLKQFFQLAGGVVVSLIIYATPLPGIIKWPLILFFSLIGVGLAFLPIQERPLSTWFFAFMKAVYSPTEYVYIQNGAEAVFAPGSSLGQPTAAVQPQPSGVFESFEQAEKGFMQRVATLFQTTGPAKQVGANSQPTVVVPETPASPQRERGEPSTQDTNPTKTFPQVVMKVEEETESSATPAKIEPIQNQPQEQASSAPQQVVYTPPVTPAFPPVQATPPPTQTVQPVAPVSTTLLPPEKPNTLVGQVLDAAGNGLDSAILEIRDKYQTPVRALRTNKLGNFITVTPLYNAEFEIITEKEGLEFEPVKFKAEGGIIEPITIKAKP